MARPKRTIQRKANGIFMVVLWINGKRTAKSLETRDQVQATKRAAQAIAELQQAATTGEQSRWTSQ